MLLWISEQGSPLCCQGIYTASLTYSYCPHIVPLPSHTLRPDSSVKKMALPIQNINDDVFAYIVSFIEPANYNIALWNNPFSPLKGKASPLTSLRYISQVCQSWRRVTLDTPLLWANRIILNDLNQGLDAWRTEVMKRTSGCHLHVGGFNLTSNTPSTEFLFHLLQHHGKQLRSMYLSLSQGELVTDKRWTLLRVPSSKLNSLHLRSNVNYGYFGELTNVDAFGLFQDAPELHTLVLDGFRAHPTSMRLPGIRDLEILNAGLEIDTLKVLSKTMRLEHLALVNIHFLGRDPAEVDTPSPVIIRLQNLQSIKLDLDQHTFLMFLPHMILNSNCSTDITILYRSDSHDYDEMRKWLIPHLQTALDKALFFSVDSLSLLITNTTRYSKIPYASPGSFSMRVKYDTEKEFSELIHLFSDVICAAAPSNIEALTLRVPERAYYTGNKTHMRRIFRAIPHVKTIYTHSCNLHSLSRQIAVEPALFACLDTLVLGQSPYSIMEPDAILAFSQQMRAAGSPVCTIRLSKALGATQDIYDRLVLKNYESENVVLDIFFDDWLVIIIDKHLYPIQYDSCSNV